MPGVERLRQNRDLQDIKSSCLKENYQPSVSSSRQTGLGYSLRLEIPRESITNEPQAILNSQLKVDE